MAAWSDGTGCHDLRFEYWVLSYLFHCSYMLYLSESANHKRKDNFLKIEYLQSSDTWTDSKLFTAIKKAKVLEYYIWCTSKIHLYKGIKVLGNATRKINNQKEEGNLYLFINEQKGIYKKI